MLVSAVLAMLDHPGLQPFPVQSKPAFGYSTARLMVFILLLQDACNVGDEGGFAPNIASNEEGLNLVNQAIEVGKNASETCDCATQLYWLYRCCLRSWMEHDIYPATCRICSTDIMWLLGHLVCEMYLSSVGHIHLSMPRIVLRIVAMLRQQATQAR